MLRTLSAPQTPRSESEKLIKLKIISEQAGHRYASTTALGVSDDYRSRLVRRSLEARPELWEDAL